MLALAEHLRPVQQPAAPAGWRTASEGKTSPGPTAGARVIQDSCGRRPRNLRLAASVPSTANKWQQTIGEIVGGRTWKTHGLHVGLG